MASDSRTHRPDPNRHNQSPRGQPVSYLRKDIGKAFSLMKIIDSRYEAFVKELENAVVELVDTYEECWHFSSAIESVGVIYQPGPELTDFDKLLKNEVAQLKANSSSVPQNHPLMRQFREAVWKVHHAGEPRPGEEQEDIIMTSNQSTILNVTCPLSGRVSYASMFMTKGQSHSTYGKTTHAALLQLDKVKHDPFLAAEIDDLRKMQNQSVMTDVMDATEFEELLDDFRL